VAEPIVIIMPLPPLQVVSLVAFKGRAAALSEAVLGEFGAALPDALRWFDAGSLAFLWTGPERWLVTAPPGPDLEDRLRDPLGQSAAITDQSASRAGWRISGPSSRDALAKLIRLDLHPRSFRAGHVATTIAAHINVQLWQIDEAPTYGIMAARSMAESLEHALMAATG
jgi:methylglutamate dehydrogenase subunit D